MNEFMEDQIARYDYIREAYGDPCPHCKTLRWQADCPKCYDDMIDDQLEGIEHYTLEDVLILEAQEQPLATQPIADDDIPF
jgi:hypothetical protein